MAGDCESDTLWWPFLQATFGPFYRIEQLILSTTPAAQAPYQSPSGLPAILTDANIRLLFQMQKAVDALAAPVAGSNASATLQQVCYKPLGNDCAMQSVLQAWLYLAAGVFCEFHPLRCFLQELFWHDSSTVRSYEYAPASSCCDWCLKDLRSEGRRPL